jgi:hypothetical protein
MADQILEQIEFRKHEYTMTASRRTQKENSTT